MANRVGACRRPAMLAFACMLLAAVIAVAVALSAPGSAYAASQVVLKPGKAAKVTLYADSATQDAATLKVAGKKAAKGVWKSSKKKVATVSKGKVKAKKSGKTTITAKYGKKSYKANVVVKNVSINKKSATLDVGSTVDLSLQGDSIKKATSSKTLVATVTPAGKVVAKKAGTATITLVSKKGKSYACSITVKATSVSVSSIAFDKAALTMKTGDDPVVNAATVAPANATNKNVSYSTSDKNVATVDANGAIEAVGVGEAVITAKSVDGGKTATCAVKVDPGKVKAASAADVKRALQSGYGYEAIVLSTASANVDLRATEGDAALAATAANTELIVNAPKTSLENFDKWKNVTIEAISPNTYTEHSDNAIRVRSAMGRLVVAEGGRASIDVESDVKNLRVENAGSIDKLDVRTEGTVEIAGTSDQDAIPTQLNAAGTVRASVVLEVSANVKAKLVLFPGSEGTTVSSASESLAPAVEGIGVVSFNVRADGAVTDAKTIVADYNESVAERAVATTLKGTVRDSEGELLSGANVRLYAYTSDFDVARYATYTPLKPAATTDAEGAYSFARVKAGNYIVVATKDGYDAAAMNVYLNNVEGDAYSPDVVMVPASTTGSGSVAGQIIDSAESGNVGLANMTLRVRAGLNNLTGDVVHETRTDAQGYYTVESLAAGAYTIEAVDLRNDAESFYISTHFNVNVYAGQQSTAGVGMTKTISKGEMRFILHWNDEASGAPSDLDSHLRGPDGSNGLFHVYYSDREYESGDVVMADLDRDDTDWEGPETTTIRRKASGLYHYLVHDFSNEDSTSSSEMSRSGAYVEVYSGATRVQVFYVPSNTPGTVWYVCTYDPATNAITPVNTMGFEQDASEVGSDIVYGDLKVTDLKKNDFVKDYRISSSSITVETTQDVDKSMASKIVPTVAERGATASVAYDEDEGDWTVTISNKDMSRTYRLYFRTYYGDLKVTGFQTNGVITDYSIGESEYGNSDRVELTSTKSDFSAAKSSIVPQIAQAGATYVIEEDDDGDAFLRISNASGTLTRSYRIYLTRDWNGLELAGVRSLDESVVTDVEYYSSEIEVYTTVGSFDAAAFERYINLTYGTGVVSHEVVGGGENGELELILKDSTGETRSYYVSVYRDWGDLRIADAQPANSAVTYVDWGSSWIEVGISAWAGVDLTPANFDSLVDVSYGSAVASHKVIERDGDMRLVLTSATGEERECYIEVYKSWGDLYIADITFSHEAVTNAEWGNYSEGDSSISLDLSGSDLTEEIVKSLEFTFGSDTVSGTWSQDDGQWVYTITDSQNPGVSRNYRLSYYSDYDEE